MRTRPDYWYRQSAAVPVREREGELEVLLVTSMRSGKWILPKGIVEPGMTPRHSAEKEAWEEAGVKGTIGEAPIGHYVNRKWGGLCKVDAYRLNVTEVAEDWLESGKRKRRWFPIPEAARLMKSDEAAGLIRKLGQLKHQLTLMRHAKSSWSDQSLADFDRPLTKRGKREAPEMGSRLAKASLIPDLIVSSPAKRALRTARLVAEVLGLEKAGIMMAEEIYEAEETELSAVVRELPATARHVMLVGHNPGVSDFARTLLKQPLEDLPTSGIITLELELPEWAALEPGLGKLLFHEYPKKEDVTETRSQVGDEEAKPARVKLGRKKGP